MIYNHPIGNIEVVYKWYILPIAGLYVTYHLLREPGNSIDGRNSGKTPVANQLSLVVYPHYLLLHPRWLGMGFLNHQQYDSKIFRKLHSYLGGFLNANRKKSSAKSVLVAVQIASNPFAATSHPQAFRPRSHKIVRQR